MSKFGYLFIIMSFLVFAQPRPTGTRRQIPGPIGITIVENTDLYLSMTKDARSMMAKVNENNQTCSLSDGKLKEFTVFNELLDGLAAIQSKYIIEKWLKYQSGPGKVEEVFLCQEQTEEISPEVLCLLKDSQGITALAKNKDAPLIFNTVFGLSVEESKEAVRFLTNIDKALQKQKTEKLDSKELKK